MRIDSANHHYSERRARPEKSTYLFRHVLTASGTTSCPVQAANPAAPGTPGQPGSHGDLRMRPAVMGALTLSKSDMPWCKLDSVAESPTLGVLLRHPFELRPQLDGTELLISRLRKRR
jgi:hypothetical protein